MEGTKRSKGEAEQSRAEKVQRGEERGAYIKGKGPGERRGPPERGVQDWLGTGGARHTFGGSLIFRVWPGPSGTGKTCPRTFCSREHSASHYRSINRVWSCITLHALRAPTFPLGKSRSIALFARACKYLWLQIPGACKPSIEDWENYCNLWRIVIWYETFFFCVVISYMIILWSLIN